jgi:predicted nucleic-acid-binding Zn-ribbon protein
MLNKVQKCIKNGEKSLYKEKEKPHTGGMLYEVFGDFKKKFVKVHALLHFIYFVRKLKTFHYIRKN